MFGETETLSDVNIPKYKKPRKTENGFFGLSNSEVAVFFTTGFTLEPVGLEPT